MTVAKVSQAPAWMAFRKLARSLRPKKEPKVLQSPSTVIERPEASILDIAFETGYASKTVFNHQFRKLVGMSPSEYRESRWA